MDPDNQSDAGLLAAFAAGARRHPGVSVPLCAAALVAGLGFSVSAYTFASMVAQSEELHVPTDFVPMSSRVEMVGRGIIITGLLGVIGLVVILLLDLLARRFRNQHPGGSDRALRRWLAERGPGFELSARAAGLVAVAAALAMVWLNAIALAAFIWTPNPISAGWVVADTFGTKTPVLALENEKGELLLRPLRDLGGGRLGACGPVTRSAEADAVDLRYDEDLGRLVELSDC
jgi:hypothetical protein